MDLSVTWLKHCIYLKPSTDAIFDIFQVLLFEICECEALTHKVQRHLQYFWQKCTHIALHTHTRKFI